MGNIYYNLFHFQKIYIHVFFNISMTRNRQACNKEREDKNFSTILNFVRHAKTTACDNLVDLCNCMPSENYNGMKFSRILLPPSIAVSIEKRGEGGRKKGEENRYIKRNGRGCIMGS